MAKEGSVLDSHLRRLTMDLRRQRKVMERENTRDRVHNLAEMATAWGHCQFK